jgi:hypothetical protein
LRLWSIQTVNIWDILQQQDVFRSRADGLPDQHFERPYRWMAEQLARRIEAAPSGCRWPIWAWQQWQDSLRQKPDLRTTGHLSKGMIGVRLKIEIDPTNVLLSDFELWHYVLNYWYLPTSEEDGAAFEQELAQQGLSFYTTKPLPEPYHSKITGSWEQIFDLDRAVEGISRPRPCKSIQAVFWELHIQHITKVDTFKAR